MWSLSTPSGLTGREVPLPLWQPAPGTLTAILGAGADGRAAKRLQAPVTLCTYPALLPTVCRLPVLHSWFSARPLEKGGGWGQAASLGGPTRGPDAGFLFSSLEIR